MPNDDPLPLPLADLRNQLTKRLSLGDLKIVWFDLFERTLDDECPNIGLPEGVIKLLDSAIRREIGGNLVQLILRTRPDLKEVLQPVVAPSAMSLLNPYDPWLPAIGDRFVGRTVELRRLQNALGSGHGVNLVGDWRVGKTSLLKFWAERAKTSGREVTYLNAGGAHGMGIAEFVETITHLPATNKSDEAANQLSKWADLCIRQSGLSPLVIVDESDSLLSRVESRFLERLHDMLGRLLIVFGSRPRLDPTNEKLRQNSPLHKRLERIWVGLLNSDEANQLIDRGQSHWRHNDREQLLYWCGTHSFYLQLLAFHLFLVRSAGEGDFEDAFDRFASDASERLSDTITDCSNNERKALNQLAAGEVVNMSSLRTRGLLTKDNRPFGQFLINVLQEKW